MGFVRKSRTVIPRRSPALHTIARHASRFDELRRAMDDGMNAEKDLSSIGKRGETLLHAAVYSNNPDSVACVLRGRPELVAAKDAKGETPLHKAIRLKPSNAKGIQRQQAILRMLLDEKRVDLNAFGDYVWVAKSAGYAKFSWRLNLLRFAVVYNATEPVVALLDEHGAAMAHNPDGTDEPLTTSVLTSRVYPKRHLRRTQFFVGLIRHETRYRRTLPGQHLMLRRYPEAMHLGYPTLQNIISASSGSIAEANLLDRLIGTHFPAPQLANAFQYRLGTPFFLVVMAMEGGVDERLNVGQMLRCVRRNAVGAGYQAIWDALLTDFKMSNHQQCSPWDYRAGALILREPLLELEELQAPVLFEAADLV